MNKNDLSKYIQELTNCHHIELRRNSIFHRHCGRGMYRVKTFYLESNSCIEHPSFYRGRDVVICSCPSCKAIAYICIGWDSDECF